MSKRTRAHRKTLRKTLHGRGCSGRLKVVPITRGGGIRCDCGLRWECY